MQVNAIPMDTAARQTDGRCKSYKCACMVVVAHMLCSFSHRPPHHPQPTHLTRHLAAPGASQHAAAEDTSPEVAAALLNLNLEGPLGLARATLPHMVAQGRGQHVIVASMSGARVW